MRKRGDGMSVDWSGTSEQVKGAINVPKGIQSHIPVIVGGNGRQRTAGLAVRFADELNFVFLSAAEIRERITEVRARCEQARRRYLRTPHNWLSVIAATSG